ncbi:MAG TPA: hypothetical protein VEH86_01730 [Candidatus Acidoferrum sp.]|nr:hypothetical protein [Candidatus Acidoferrum sp.]
MLKRESIHLLVGFLVLQVWLTQSCCAQMAPPTPAQQKAQDEENKQRLKELLDQFQSSLLVEEPVPSGRTTFLSPQHDLRLVAKFYAAGYGDTIG